MGHSYNNDQKLVGARRKKIDAVASSVDKADWTSGCKKNVPLSAQDPFSGLLFRFNEYVNIKKYVLFFFEGDFFLTDEGEEAERESF